MIACARAYVFNKCSLDRHSPTCKGIISPALLGFSVLEAMASAYFTPSRYGQPLAAVITFYVELFIFNIPIIPMEVPHDFGEKFLTSQTVHRRTVWIRFQFKKGDKSVASTSHVLFLLLLNDSYKNLIFLRWTLDRTLRPPWSFWDAREPSVPPNVQ